MKKILLACGAGLSTSMMVQAMKIAAQELNLKFEIWAEPVSTAITMIGKVDVILLGPQVRFELKRFCEKATLTKIDVIDIKDYGLMDGKSVVLKLQSLFND